MNRKVLFIGIAVMLLVAVGWWFLLFRPAGTDLEDARTELELVDSELINTQNQLARLRSIEADLPRLQSGIERLRAAVPDDVGLADFILAINEAALASGLEVRSIVPEIPRQGLSSGLGEINVGLNTSGGYYKVLDFLNRMSTMHRVITVESIGLAASREENPAAEPTLEVTIQARIYVNPVTALPGLGGGDDGSVEATEEEAS